MTNLKEYREKILNKERRDHAGYYPKEKIIQAWECKDCDYIPKVPNAGMVFEDSSNPYQLMHNGIKVVKDGHNGTWMTDLIQGFQGHYEPQEEKVFYEVLKYLPENAVMIELGSWWAYYSLWFAKAVKYPTNYLIEPCQIRLELGEKNFSLNEAHGIFVQGFLGAKPMEASCQKASKVGIDSFLKERNIDQVNILHCDIQGYETDMLISAEQAIRDRKIDYFFISTHSGNEPFLSFFQSHDYTIVAEHSMAEGYMPDGLIVAKRKELNGPNHIETSKVNPAFPIW